MAEDLTKKNVVPSTLNILGMQREKRCRFFFFFMKEVHVKSINVTIQQVTKGIHWIEGMDTLFLYYSCFSKTILLLPQSHLRWHCTDYSTFVFLLSLVVTTNWHNHRFFLYCQVSGLVRSPQQKFPSGSESIPDRLLPDLVDQGVGRLVAAIWYQCSTLWLVRYFRVLNFGVLLEFEGPIFRFGLIESFETILVFSTICVVTNCVCRNSSLVIIWVLVRIWVVTTNKNTSLLNLLNLLALPS